MEEKTYWFIRLIVFFSFLGEVIIRIISFFDEVIALIKSYRSFLKILAVTGVSLIIGRFIIWNWSIGLPEDQSIVWLFSGLTGFLYFGNRIFKTKNQTVIDIFQTFFFTAIFSLIIFRFFTYYEIFGPLSQKLLEWPTVVCLLVLVSADIWNFFSLGWSKPISVAERRKRKAERRERKKERNPFYQYLVSWLVVLLLGVVVLIFSGCLKEELSATTNILQLIGTGICGIWIFVSFLLTICVVFFTIINPSEAEQQEMLKNISTPMPPI